jgi:glycosyltransferase involved in cell wall biosynthesis
LKIDIKNFVKFFLTSVFVNKISLVAIKISNFILQKILNGFIEQQINKIQYKKENSSYSQNKIIYIISNLGSGGAERQLINLINHLSDPTNYNKFGKFEILLVCFNCKQFPNNFYLSQLTKKIRIIDLNEDAGFKYFIKELRKRIHYFWLGKNLIYLNRLEELVALEKPQIIHAWLDTPSICGGIAGILNRVPNIILSTRSCNPNNFLSNRFYRKSVYQVLSNYKQVTFLNNSKAGASSYEKWLGMTKENIGVIYNGFNIKAMTDFYSSNMKNKLSHGIIIGGVMRLSYEKNVKLWLQSAKVLSEMAISARFIIIGNGPELSRVKRYIRKLELSKSIELIDSTINVYDYMSKFDLLLLTSRTEGLPNVLIEAQLLGIPVISTDCGGANETFIDKSTGLLVNNSDPKLIADAIFSLVCDKKKLASYSISAIKQAIPRFDIDIITQEYVNIYNKI